MEALLYLHVLTITILSNESFCASAFVVAFNLRTNTKIVTWVGFAHVLLYKSNSIQKNISIFKVCCMWFTGEIVPSAILLLTVTFERQVGYFNQSLVCVFYCHMVVSTWPHGQNQFSICQYLVQPKPRSAIIQRLGLPSHRPLLTFAMFSLVAICAVTSISIHISWAGTSISTEINKALSINGRL